MKPEVYGYTVQEREGSFCAIVFRLDDRETVSFETPTCNSPLAAAHKADKWIESQPQT